MANESSPVAGDRIALAPMLRYVAMYMRQNAGEHRGIPDTLTSKADAVDVLRGAVKGCGKHCGDECGWTCDGESFDTTCTDCVTDRIWPAIAALLGGDDATA